MKVEDDRRVSTLRLSLFKECGARDRPIKVFFIHADSKQRKAL